MLLMHTCMNSRFTFIELRYLIKSDTAVGDLLRLGLAWRALVRAVKNKMGKLLTIQ